MERSACASWLAFHRPPGPVYISITLGKASQVGRDATRFAENSLVVDNHADEGPSPSNVVPSYYKLQRTDRGDSSHVVIRCRIYK